MPIELNSDKAVCFRCGTAYSQRKGYFPVSYAALHKGTGFAPVCKTCIEEIYNDYLKQCGDAKSAVRQTCRKLDLYWNDSIYDGVAKKAATRSMIIQYIAKINTVNYAGKSYDDSLLADGTLWSFRRMQGPTVTSDASDGAEQSEGGFTVTDEVRAFWGSGYTPTMYAELEERRAYWMKRLPAGDELEVGTEALIRQICALELDINRDRAAGRPVDKSVTALNTLLGSANLKPVQKKPDDAEASMTNTPLGVWLYKYENQRPLPEVDDDLKDVNHINKYIFTWMGHLCKMLGIKNTYSKMYEDEIARLRVEHPEYDGDDDETMVTDILSEDGDSS